MDLQLYMKSIEQTAGDTRIELIQLMKEEIETNKKLVIGDISKLFIFVKSLLNDTVQSAMILEIFSLVQSIMSHILPNEIEQNIPLLLDNLLALLCDTDKSIRKATKELLLTFLSKTHNIEVISRALIDKGLASSNYYQRERTLNFFPEIIIAEQYGLFSKLGSNDARRLLEAIIVHVNDSHQTVRDQAVKVILKIKDMSIENFDLAFNRLSTEQQQVFSKVTKEKQQLKKQKFIKLNFEALDQYSEADLQQSLAQSEQSVKDYFLKLQSNDPGMTIEERMELYQRDYRTQLYFGFLKPEILQDCLNDRDPKIREYGIKQLCESFFDTTELLFEPDNDTTTELMFQNLQSQAITSRTNNEHLPQFLGFITHMFALNNNSYMIHGLLSVLYQILLIPGVHHYCYLSLCFPGLINLLNDDRVNIRRKSVFLLRKIQLCLKRQHFLMNIMFFLDDISTSEVRYSWHAKEEIINLVSLLVLDIHSDDKWFYEENQKEKKTLTNNNEKSSLPISTSSINFTKILTRIAFYLDDSVAKVRLAALECLAVFCNNNNQSKFLEILFQLLDQRIYEKLLDKLQSGRVYYLNENGNLQLPAIRDLPKLDQQREAYLENESRVNQFKAEQSPIQEEEVLKSQVEEKDEQEVFQITLYEKSTVQPQFPISYRDRVEKTNKMIDSLFANENLGFGGSTKYDVEVPIGDIKITTFTEPIQGGYLAASKPDQQDNFNYGDFVMDEEPPTLEYQTRPLRYRGIDQVKQSRSRVQVSNNQDIQSRVQQQISQLNEDKRVDLQIPKAYEAYQYNYQDNQDDDENEIVFLDTKAIKKEYATNKKSGADKPEDDTIQRVPLIFQETPAELLQKGVQQRLIDEGTKFTVEQKYEQRLKEFLLCFENKGLDKNRGRNARKLKQNIVGKAQVSENLPWMAQFQLPDEQTLKQMIAHPSAEVTALILNLSVIELEQLFESVTKLRRLLRNHFEVFYETQLPLVQLVNDVCRLLSTSKDNPILNGNFWSYKYPSQQIVRTIVVNVLQAISEIAKAFRRAVDPCVKNMFNSVGIWLRDQSQAVSQQAEQTMLEILRYCDDTQVYYRMLLQLYDILPRIYDPNSFTSKIYVGVLVEHLIIKWQYAIFKSQHFEQIVTMISRMVSDREFDVRRQGKKNYFRLLSLGDGLLQIESVIDHMNPHEAEKMRELIHKHNELEQDHQIGIKYQPRIRPNQHYQQPKEQDLQQKFLISEVGLSESLNYYDFGDYRPSSVSNQLDK